MTQADRRIRVAVIYGGRSSEHNISCVSAGAIMAHLDPTKYEVVPVGITKQGKWVVGENDPEHLKIIDRKLPEVPADGTEVILSPDPARKGQFLYLDGTEFATVDVVFPLLHGKYGEDGTIQGLLMLAGIPFVGAGVLASAAGMDKSYTKRLLNVAGVPTVPGVVVTSSEPLDELTKQELGLPVFVKPVRGGSSIGVSRVTRWEYVPAAIELALQEDNQVLIESEAHGPEVECGVLALPDGEIITSVPARLIGTDHGGDGFYDFDTKYLDDIVGAEIPAQLPEETIAQIRQLSVQAFRALGSECLSRVDFFVTANGPVVNEINTMPGFTPISMYPQVFAASGISYEKLLDLLIQRALTCSR